MKPNLNLTLNDPLAEQAVTIVLHLAPGENQAERPLLLSLGVPNKLPVQVQGVFTDLERLIRTAWTSFGMQMKANAAATATPTSHPETDDEGGDEAFDAAVETDDITVATAPLTPPASTPPASAKPTNRPVLEQPTLSFF